jgi:hypothetical protein
MFAPAPWVDDGWYVIEGVLMDSTRIDLWRGYGPPSETKPKDVASTYKNQQWRSYFRTIWLRDNNAFRLYFGRYLCRNWNETHTGSKRVNLIFITYMLETTPPPGMPVPQATKVELWRHYCYVKPAGW